MGEGVEWALHSCLLLAWVGDGSSVPVAKLAAFHALPRAYLNKQLQALVRAGIVSSTPGVRGGFRLARDPARITLLDVVSAIEGPQAVFRCTEIRRRGAGAQAPDSDFRLPCAVASAMHRAERAWRRALAAETLADIMQAAERAGPSAPRAARTRLEQAQI